MKSVLITSLFLLLNLGSTKSQSTERFIRIIGNATYTFEASFTRVNFSVNETAKNDYRKTEASSFDESLSEFKKKLDSLKIISNLTENSNYKYNISEKIKSKEYYIDLSNKKDVDRLIEIQNQKYDIKNITYLYKEPNFNVEDKLANEAINDAKLKASSICLKLGKKLGEILNIETRSNGCCSNINESSNSTDQKKYSITVTFELLNL